jgi:hypothetical protein
MKEFMIKVLFYITLMGLFCFIFIQCKGDDFKPELTGDWIPPIGIPRPSFGIEDNYRMFDDELKWNPDLVYQQNDEGGFYTHYVDNTAPNATDLDNRYGSRSLPRKTWPDDKSILPGPVLEIHGGPYTLESLTYKANATSELPVFIRGYSSTNRVKLIAGLLYLNFQYVIFENFEKTQTGLMVRTLENNEAHHVGIRNCEVHDYNNVNHGISAVCWINGKSANNIVIYNNIIHPDNFDPMGGEFPQNDILGVYLTMKTNNVWVVDNTI